MNKLEKDHLIHRVNGIVQCTNGQVATILNRGKKRTGLTDSAKYKMIVSGQATVKTENQLVKIEHRYNSNGFDVLLGCFEYPTTDTQKEKIAYNKNIDAKIEEIMSEIELEGKRLIDKVVLGITPTKDIPDELHKLGTMVSLAR